MKQFIFSLLFLSISFYSKSQDNMPAKTLNKTNISSVIKGVTIQNVKLVANDGYEFIKGENENTAILKKKESRDIEGTFTCFCANGEGVCTVSVSPTSVQCSKGSCSSPGCVMLVDIPGIKGTTSGVRFKVALN